jgi:hypothetical protein
VLKCPKSGLWVLGALAPYRELHDIVLKRVKTHGLEVRKGPFFTNFSYVLSAEDALVDDLASDPWQRDARAVDLAVLLIELNYSTARRNHFTNSSNSRN